MQCVKSCFLSPCDGAKSHPEKPPQGLDWLRSQAASPVKREHNFAASFEGLTVRGGCGDVLAAHELNDAQKSAVYFAATLRRDSQ